MTFIADKPGSCPKELQSLWVVISDRDDEGEGICGTMSGGAWMPLITGDEAKLDWLRSYARTVTELTGIKTRMVCYSARVTLEEFEPPK